MKKNTPAFTLIEMLIVIVIIGILLVAMVFLGAGQIRKLQFRNDKALITNTHTDVVGWFLWSSVHNGQRVTQGAWNPTEENISVLSTTDELTNPTPLFSIDKQVWFDIGKLWHFSHYDPTTMTQAPLINTRLLLQPYKVWCTLEDQDSTPTMLYTGGFFTFSFMYWWVENEDMVCYHIDLGSCKLYERKAEYDVINDKFRCLY